MSIIDELENVNLIKDVYGTLIELDFIIFKMP